jgi:ABC-type Co2+ transport system permease subunit
MHIEPGLVTGEKLALAAATAAVAGSLAIVHIRRDIAERGLPSLLVRMLIAMALVLVFFQILPHFSAGISEVHFIFGTTLFLVLGSAATACGLAGGLLVQGLLFHPQDLPQYAMNVTTLLLPLFAMSAVAKRIIPGTMAYVDLKYSQALTLSMTYQAGIVAWVAFWAIYGNGFAAENLQAIGAFAAAYASVLLIEPLVDLAVLWAAKRMALPPDNVFVARRLNAA